MSAFRQAGTVMEIGLRSLSNRTGNSLVIVLGVAIVVTVLVATLAIATGFQRAAVATGSATRAIVLGGATETTSEIARDSVGTIIDAPGVKKQADGQPAASPETILFVPVTDEHTGRNAFAPLRGIGPQGALLRPELQVVAGRLFARDQKELVVGRGLLRQLGIDIGTSITLPNGDWKVVGVVTTGGTVHDSELFADVDRLLDAYGRKYYNAITLALENEAAFDRFSAALAADPRTAAVKAYRERDYYATQTRGVSTLLLVVAYGIGGIMAFGAAFAALNTMYAAVSTRAPEIATLRALGFGAGAVVASVLIEALLLGLAGAALGGLAAWLLLDGSTVSTMTGFMPSQLTFGVRVSPELIAIGAVFALGIGAAGGVFAAFSAARMPVASALRKV